MRYQKIHVCMGDRSTNKNALDNERETPNFRTVFGII